MRSLDQIVTSLDRDEQMHLARLLLLIKAFDRGDEGRSAIEGITKLAKLDFLLRYPTYFEKAMLARKVSAKHLRIDDFERNTVEAQMVRYRFGPWDHRYRRFLNILAAKGLISIGTSGRTILINLSEKGRGYASTIESDGNFQIIASRAKVLKDHIDIGATDIMNFIYKTFPEIATLSYDEVIKP